MTSADRFKKPLGQTVYSQFEHGQPLKNRQNKDLNDKW